MEQKLRLKRTNVPDKEPSANTMDYGEVYINYASGLGKSFLSSKNMMVV